MNELLENLVEKCNLGAINEEPIRIEGGLLNKMYKVITTSGKYAIKFINPEVMRREDGKKNIIFSEKVANRAKTQGINCVAAKVINGELIQTVSNTHFLIFDWFEGKPIEDDKISLEKCNIISKELAFLHNIDFDDVKKECNIFYETNIIDWDFYLSKINNEIIKKEVNQIKDRFSELDKESIKNLEMIKNQTVISHRDLDLPNVLWNEKNEPVIIDWETSGLVHPALEAIDTAWNWSGGKDYFDKEKFKSFIINYEKNGGKLNDYEKAFKADFKAKLRWLEYNLKRVTIFDFIDKEEKELGFKEVIRSIDEIRKFDLYRKDMEFISK